MTKLDLSQLPRLVVGDEEGNVREERLKFEPITSDGRVNAMAHRLYTTAQTGADGPAAAIMHYLPGAVAKPHLHPGYELIFVLQGELETDDGTYGANTLLVMPPNSVHAPRSPKGCVGLVVWEQPVKPA